MNSDRFGEIKPEWRQRYLTRTPEQLAKDMVAACDQLRTQRKDINLLRSQLLAARIKNTVLVALVGGAAAKGIEVIVIALWHSLAPVIAR
jgi:hypothetical protein